MNLTTNRRVIITRLTSQRLTGPLVDDVLETVRWMGALQAQDYGQAVWGLGLRTASATLQTVEAALQAGTVIRTWPMRGTVHFVPAEDAEWMLGLGAARMIAADHNRLGALGLDEAILARCRAIAEAGLQGRALLARPQLLQLFEDQGISTKNGRGYHILWRLSQEGVLCIGPMIGKQQSFALLHQWAPPQRKLGREEALTTLAERYFRSHGPATVHDFAWWSGLKITDCKAGIQAAAGKLVSSKNNNAVEVWYSNDAKQYAYKASGLQLLPGFDEYFLGYKDRRAFTNPAHMQYIVPGNNGVFKPVIVVGGQVIGTWQRKILKSSVKISLTPFDAISNLYEQALPAAEAYARFHGLKLRLEAE